MMKHRGFKIARKYVGLTVLLVEQKVTASNILRCSGDKVAHELALSMKGSHEKIS